MIADYFKPDGHIVRTLNKAGLDAEVREPQVAFAQHLADNLALKRPVLIDAETGVGKTLGYLIPMLHEAFSGKYAKGIKPLVVVSTATVMLQRQLIEKDIPVATDIIENALSLKLNTAFRVGRAQIIDEEALEKAIDELAEPGDMQLVNEMLEWTYKQLDAGKLALRSELLEHFAARLKKMPYWLKGGLVNLDSGPNESRASIMYSDMVQRCDDADILVINHHLMALNMLRQFLWREERPVFIVIDEADRLPSVVEQVNRSQVPFHILRAQLNKVPTKTEAVKRSLDNLIDITQTVSERPWSGSGGSVLPLSRVSEQKRNDIVVGLADCVKGLDRTVEHLARVGFPMHNGVNREIFSRIQSYAFDMAAIADIAKAKDSSRALLYYTQIKAFPGLALSSTSNSRMISYRLWTKTDNDVRGLLFTSATLGTMAQSDVSDAYRALRGFIGDCGFSPGEIHPDACALIAPAKFGKMNFVRPPLDGPKTFTKHNSKFDDDLFSLNPDAVDLWKKMILAASNGKGRTLVLLPSFRDIQALASIFDELGDRLIVQTADVPTNAAIVRFMKMKNSVWLSASAWEGISLPGAISNIVIPRIPIRPVQFTDTLLEQYLMEVGKSKNAGRSITFARRMADARRRMRQGIGRGIRSSKDNMTLWIGDPRWPMTQVEIDQSFAEQPETWSSTMINTVSVRFRKKLQNSSRFEQN